ncbi:MAG TPA: type II secretion system protein N [Casimicrobiaceae bacterium]|jgi:hypothetical protein|nr:type II secretion system protein N [Casimicrobiaceae bacterium]
MSQPPAIIATRPGWRALAIVATLIAGAALAYVIAYWTWRLIAPAAVHVAPAEIADPASAIVAGRLFGTPARDAAPGAPPSDSLGEVRLLGIVARRDGAGYAVFRLPSGPRVVATGEDVSPGLRLVSVTADGVTVRGSDGERTLALRSGAPRDAAPPRGAAAVTTPRVAPVQPAPAPPGLNVATNTSGKCNPPPGFKGEIVRLNVELVGGLISQPDTWRSMVEPQNGALTVRDTGGFGQMIGLQPGDRVEQANGIALTAPDDVVGAVLRPLAANQPVRLTGKRNGQPRELWIANASCSG